MSQVSDDIRQRAEGVLGYCFQNPQFLAEALTHSSVAEHRLSSNERMEFLGDSVLGGVVCEHLYRNYPQYMEGEMTKIKSAVVSRKVCADISAKLGLTDLMSLGKGMNGREGLPSSLAAAVLESVVAAIYLDGGHEPAKRFILEHVEPVIRELVATTHQHNYKSLLQQHAQKTTNQLPLYRVMDEKGPDHSKCFEVAVEIAGHRHASAWGPNKKQAEQAAALSALRELGLIEAEAGIVEA